MIFRILILFIFSNQLFALPLYNFHRVGNYPVYRASQPTGKQLKKMIENYELKTVINLCGEKSGNKLWEEEVQVCENKGVHLVNIRLSALSLPSKQNLLLVYDALTDAELPMLIHCAGGSNRTGAVSAIWRMMMGESRKMAQEELSPKYFHFQQYYPMMDLLVEHFEPDREWIIETYDSIFIKTIEKNPA